MYIYILFSPFHCSQMSFEILAKRSQLEFQVPHEGCGYAFSCGPPFTRARPTSTSATGKVFAEFANGIQPAIRKAVVDDLCAGWTKAGGVGRQKRGARFPWNSNPLDSPTRGGGG